MDRERTLKGTLFYLFTALSALLIVIFLLGIFYILFSESYPAIKRFGLLGFVLSQEWDPVRDLFGAAPTIFGTVVTTLMALIFALPVSLGIAIFVTEIAPDYIKTPVSVAIELLAAIPSIIYGMWGLFTLSPIMAEYIEPALQATLGRLPVVGRLFEGVPMGIDLLTAGVILSIMIIPLIASISRDAFNLVPAIVKESAYGVGATRWEVIKKIVLPYSKLGIFGGVILAMGRALGETMAVAFVLGNKHQITSSLLDAAATITVSLANEFTEADTDLYLSSLFYLSLILFAISFVTLGVAKLTIHRLQRGGIR